MTTYSPCRYLHELSRQTFCFVLAGGKGSRLQDLTKTRAKPATPFGGRYRIIDFTLSNCINSGLRRIGVATQYNALQLINHLQDTWGHLRSEMSEYVRLLPAMQTLENSWYLGTANAVYQNLQQIEQTGAKYLLVLAGDHVYSMDYMPMLMQHAESKADITVSCLPVDARQAKQFGVVTTDGKGRITEFVEKPDSLEKVHVEDGKVLASMGIYVFNIEYLKQALMQDAKELESTHDFGHDILPKALSEAHVSTYRYEDESGNPGFWRDVGTVDSYYDTSMELLAPLPRLNLYDQEWPIWCYPYQLPPAKLSRDARGRQTTVHDSLLSSGIILSGAEVSRSVLARQVEINSGSELHQSVVLPHAKIGRNCQLHHVIVDEGCVIPDNMVIGDDPELDAQRFPMTESGLVVVTTRDIARLNAGTTSPGKVTPLKLAG